MRQLHTPCSEGLLPRSLWCTPSSYSAPRPLSIYPLLHRYRFLKGAFHERPGILAVDPMSGDGHQVASTGHGVTQQSQVAVIDVGTVKGDDVVQLPLQSLPHGFNAQHLAGSGGQSDGTRPRSSALLQLLLPPGPAEGQSRVAAVHTQPWAQIWTNVSK